VLRGPVEFVAEVDVEARSALTASGVRR